MEPLFYWLLLSTSYVALIGGLVYALPERMYRLLRPLHWGTSGLCALAVVVPLLTLGDWTFKSFGLFCLLLLASGLLAGTRAWLQLTRSARLSKIQAGLVGVVAPLLVLFNADALASDIAYSDGDFTVTVKTHVSLLRYDQNYPEVELYGTRGLVFQEYLGHIGLNATSGSVPELLTWWRGVSALSFDANSNHGVAQQGNLQVAFNVNPPYRGTAAPLTEQAPAPPQPVEDDKVYTYVEEMPQMPGHRGNVQAELTQAIQERLILPPNAQEGRVWLRLEVDKAGSVQYPSIIKGLNASTDSAVLAAATHLPQLVPGRQNGQPMKVELTLPAIVVLKAKVRPARATSSKY